MAAVELYSTPLYSDANLVAYYRLENTSDSKGSRTLTNNNSVTFTSAKFNNGANFGTTLANDLWLSYLGDNLGISGGACSLVGWINVNTQINGTAVNYDFFSQSDNTTQTDYYIEYYYNSGSPQLIFARGRRVTGDQTIPYSITLTVGTWYHVALTYNGTTLTGYLNGSVVGTPISASGNGSSTQYTNGCSIGARVYNSSFLNQSLITADDVAVFSRALTATEVSNLYNGTWSTTYPRTASVSVSKSASRVATVARLFTVKRASSATVSRAASRSATATRVKGFVRTAAASVSNTVSRLAAVGRKLTYLRTASASVSNSGTGIVDSYSETNYSGNSQLGGGAAENTKIGQAFLATANVLDSCKFYLMKSGSPTGNAVATIYALTGTPGTNAVPTGAALATSGSVDVSTISGVTHQLITFSFSGANRISLSASTYYGVTIEYSGGDSSNFVFVGSGGTYHGNPYSWSGSSWTAGFASNDLIWYVYGVVARLATANRVRTIVRAAAASVSNTVSRLAAVVRKTTFIRKASGSVSNAVSRLATAVKQRIIKKTAAISASNAVSRLATVVRKTTLNRAAAATTSRAASRSTTVARGFVLIRKVSAAVSNAAGRLATVVAGKIHIIIRTASVSTSNAVGRLTAIARSLTSKRTASAATSRSASRSITATRISTMTRIATTAVSNAASRLASVARKLTILRHPTATVSNAASRFATAIRGFTYIRNVSVSVSNAATRFASAVKGKIVKRIASVTTSYAAARLIVVTRSMTFIRNAVAMVSNAASRLAKVKVYLNGLLVMYANKYFKQNSSYGNKYNQQGTPYSDKLSQQNTSYSNKYQHPQ